MTSSPWSNHITIAIKVLSRERARTVTEKALKVPTREMEWFLTELLTETLLEFDRLYNLAYRERIDMLERLLNETAGLALPKPIILPKPEQGP